MSRHSRYPCTSVNQGAGAKRKTLCHYLAVLPVPPAPKPVAGDARLVLLLAWHPQVPEAEQGTPSDTYLFKTTCWICSQRKTPPSLPCPALEIRLTGKAVGRFMCFFFFWPDFWHGILWTSHLTGHLCTCNALSFPWSSHHSTSMPWLPSFNYEALVCH